MNSLELRAKWRRGEPSAWMWITLTDITVAEVARDLGLDWVGIDTEHGAIDLQSLQSLLIGLGDVPAIVRVPGNDAFHIKRVLDMGATGVIVPHIRSAAEASQAVAACKYPPMGIRGTGPRRAGRYGRDETEYFLNANEGTMVVLMMETIDAVNDIDAILEVEGVDALLFGPMDLCASMGLLPQQDHPRVLAAIRDVCDKARAVSMPLISGLPPAVGAEDGPFGIETLMEQGISILPMGTDDRFIQAGARRMLAYFRGRTGD